MQIRSSSSLLGIRPLTVILPFMICWIARSIASFISGEISFWSISRKDLRNLALISSAFMIQIYIKS